MKCKNWIREYLIVKCRSSFSFECFNIGSNKRIGQRNGAHKGSVTVIVYVAAVVGEIAGGEEIADNAESSSEIQYFMESLNIL